MAPHTDFSGSGLLVDGEEGQDGVIAAFLEALNLAEEVIGVAVAAAVDKELAAALDGVVVVAKDLVVAPATVLGQGTRPEVVFGCRDKLEIYLSLPFRNIQNDGGTFLTGVLVDVLCGRGGPP